jgi:hypothetical protein
MSDIYRDISPDTNIGRFWAYRWGGVGMWDFYFLDFVVALVCCHFILGILL